MRKVFVGALLGAAVLAGAAQAQYYGKGGGVTVTPTSNGSFSVPTTGKFGARSTWCAAATHAQDVQGAKGTDRVYVQQPQTSNSGPVVFGTDPGGATPVGVLGTSAALRTAGSNLSINHALQFCYDGQLINNR